MPSVQPLLSPIVTESVRYQGFDGLEPLFAEARYPAQGSPLPLVVVMHGYAGGIEAVRPELQWLAERGAFALGVEMRGRNDCAGAPDSGGLEIMDIRGAVLHVLEAYRSRLDPARVNVWGYSGGGGNALSCAVRFPELFGQVAAFFGISDYAHWHATSQYAETIAGWVGGMPDQVPWAYAARKTLAAAANNASSRIHVIWDSEETICDPWMDEQFVGSAHAAGLANVIAHTSGPEQPMAERFIHGYPNDIPGVRRFEENLLLPEALAGDAPRPGPIPDSGVLAAPGYVVTERFELWVGNGMEGLVRVEYALGDQWRFAIEPETVREGAVCRLILPGEPRAVLVNGAEVSATALGQLPPRCDVRCRW